MQVQFPPADPATYLEWVAYWREVERLMLARPALEAHASAESAPFLRDPIADWISDVLIRSILVQAADARRAGMSAVAPRLRCDPLVMRQSAEYMRRRAAWLRREGFHKAMGIEPPSPALEALRSAALRDVDAQVELDLEPANAAPVWAETAAEPTVVIPEL